MRSAAILVLIVAIWGLGLWDFAQRVQRSTPAPTPPRAEGVVALTGSNERIAAAMKLLETGKAKRMLISGVNQKVSRAELRGADQIKRIGATGRRLYDCCVDLGFQATDTVGNARETARWAAAKGYRSLIVVTSDYHMPRAMLELGAAMPGVRLTPYPVRSSELDARQWWRTGDGARRMAIEYCKYLAIAAREAVLRLGPRPRNQGQATNASDEAPAAASASP